MFIVLILKLFRAGHVSGKVLIIDNLGSIKGTKVKAVKVHVTALPMKKYALRTSWYNVSNGRAQINESFKYKTYSVNNCVLRIRVYTRRRRSPRERAQCAGEFLLHAEDIEKVKGGITVWERLTQHRVDENGCDVNIN